MRCYLLMADGEWEERIALELRRKMKELYGKSKVFFLSFRHPGVFAEKGFAEVSKDRPTQPLKAWYRLCQDLLKRRNLRERRIFIGGNLWLLALVTLLGGRRVTVVLPLGLRPFPVSSLRLFFLRHFARTVLVDDATFVQFLRLKNIPAYFVGNILADLLHPHDTPFLHGKKAICALFPREDHHVEDLGFFLDFVEHAPNGTSLYFLLALPQGVSLETVQRIASEKNWVFLESLEGEVVEGYLVRERVYLNLTRFLPEALDQATYVVSADQRILVQAVGLGKTVIPVRMGKAEETAALLLHSVSLFEYNQSMSARFGRKGAIERIAVFLLWGVVEDPALSHRLRTIHKRG